MRKLLVDTGPLVALVNARDRQHSDAVRFFAQFEGALITTIAIVTEVCALVPRRQANLFLRSVEGSRFALVHVPEQELPGLADLMERYADRPMDFADASLLWLSETSGVRDIATLDSAFHIYRTRRGHSLRNHFGTK
ncbi:MAG: type II toxin-antitoxin system VapC family toxin [Betaproteobacteria bacterium]